MKTIITAVSAMLSTAEKANSAAAAGFLIGAASVLLQAFLPLEVRPFRDAFLYTLVIACLLLRPQGLFVPSSAKPRI